MKILSVRSASALLGLSLLAALPLSSAPLTMENRRELFLDDFIVDKLTGLENRLATPTPAGEVFKFDQPWEGRFSGAFVTVIHDGPLYRMYYRGDDESPAGSHEVTCYAESDDGIHWRKPKLGLFELNGSKDNNLVLPPKSPDRVSHNFSALLDDRPGVPVAERYKAVGGGVGTAAEHKASNTVRALQRLVSADGIHWKQLPGPGLFSGWALDTQNVLAWIPAENCYAVYLRTWTEATPGKPVYKGTRLIARSTSPDFVNWSEPVVMSTGRDQPENLYTNATHPYFRAPQILLSLPFRFSPDRRVLSDDEMKAFDIHSTMWKGVSDAVIMTSRGGTTYQRKFMESFVRPGMDRSNWAARSNIPALGVVQTGPAEMSIYLSCGYGAKTRRLERATLRLDGFASLHAGYQPGSALTVPLMLKGNTLTVNFATSSVGYLKIAVLDEAGQELPGFGEKDAEELAGDIIDRPVTWKGGKSVADLAGKSVRLKFILRDADLYSFGVFSR